MTIITSAAACHKLTETAPPIRLPVTNTSSSAQNDVVKPAIARCECATSPWVNFKRSKHARLIHQKPAHHQQPPPPNIALRHTADPSGHENRAQSDGSHHTHGSKNNIEPI